MRVTITQLSDDRFAFEQEWHDLRRHVQKEKSDLVVLPELIFHAWSFIEDTRDEAVLESIVQAHERGLAELGALSAPMVTSSTLVRGDDGNIYNAGFVWQDGTTHIGARKSYLPDEAGFFEARWYSRGDKRFPLTTLGEMRAGFMICSDMWFMHAARQMGTQGANLIVSPRCTEAVSLSKWQAGAISAAFIAGAFLVSTNRVSPDGLFGGSSWVISPEGDVLAETSAISPFVTIDIDLTAADTAKRGYPRYLAD
ncbi:MAG: carbon-nitrogen hydrolase family protein [Pleurocapsa minor GSE-CHR-MK-17-07R]|jgi:N-carbamoylputrescine amidase|nr:carbon-nitrogen hydrolase family protein [Pleurocapsa minor GSE-CHR-MK 17-07R]